VCGCLELWSDSIIMKYQTILIDPPAGHSKKPECSYDMIEALSEPPRLEIFARQHRLGWDVIGDEVGIKI